MEGRPTSIRIARKSDGTSELLRGGGGLVIAGILASILLQTVLGGMTPIGAKTNGGWFALIVALMCLPFGALLLALGVAKWLRNRSEQRRERTGRQDRTKA